MKIAVLDYNTNCLHVMQLNLAENQEVEDALDILGFRLSDIHWMEIYEIDFSKLI